MLVPAFMQASNDENHITRKFSWKYQGETYSLEYHFDKSIHTYYQTRARTYHYEAYTRESPYYQFVEDFAKALKKGAEKYELDQWEMVEFIVDFVQSLEYVAETSTPEYPKYPIETLVDQGGDCEDTAILLSAILDRLGYDVILVSPPRHMAVGLACSNYKGTYYEYRDKRYYYIETTGENWAIGELPPSYKGTAKLYALNAPTTVRNTLAYGGNSDPDIDNTSADYDISFAFLRSDVGTYGTYAKRKSYSYTVLLEGEDAEKVSKVYYKRLHETFPEYANGTWILRTGASKDFSWEGWGYAPIRIKVVFRDGTVKEYYYQKSPKVFH